MAGPSSKPKRSEGEPVFMPHPDDEADVRAGLEEAERGEGVALTQEELARWAETGELPERVEKWPTERSSSRRGT